MNQSKGVLQPFQHIVRLYQDRRDEKKDDSPFRHMLARSEPTLASEVPCANQHDTPPSHFILLG